MKKLLLGIIALTLCAPLYANCGNGNGNGNGCNGGEQGPIGPKGDTGDTGQPGVAGQDGKAGEKGSNGKDGLSGKNGLNGKDANVETRLVTGVVVKIAQERYFDVESFMDYDLSYGKVGFFGMRIVIKPGKSYEQRRIEKQQKEIDSLKRMLSKLGE